MTKEKDNHTHILFAKLSDSSMDVSVRTAGHVVVIDGKLSNTPSSHLLSFSDMLSF